MLISSQGLQPIGFGSIFWLSYAFALVLLPALSIALPNQHSSIRGLMLWPGFWPLPFSVATNCPIPGLDFPMTSLLLGLLSGLGVGDLLGTPLTVLGLVRSTMS